MSRKMKNSGIEWIGEIPEEWEIVPTKRYFRSTKTIVGDKVNEYERLALTMNGVIKRDKEDSEGLQPEKFDSYQILRENELVFKLIDLENVKTSRVGISRYTGIVSPAYIVLTNKNKDNKFFYYYYMSMYYNEIFNFLGGDGVRSSLNVSDLLDIPLVSLPEEEQIHIAAFLDSKCTKIDETIEKQKQVIEKLKEYKQSITTEAVTKGLNPDVPMKDSGIEWIGAIPKNWSMVRLGRLITSTMNGLTRRAKGEIISGQIVLRIKEISDGKIDYIDVNRIELTDTESNLYSLKDGDLLFVRVNGSKNLVGKSVVFKMINEPVAYNDHIIKVSLSNDVIPDYLQLYLQSYSGKAEIEQYVNTAAGQYSISGTGIRSLCFPLPPKEEQENLYRYVYKNFIKIDNIIAQKETLVEKLNEYKKSLIYECVTGKREV